MAGIYIHIPFCKQACHYCDFHFSTTFSAYRNDLIEALLAELKLRECEVDDTIQSIYFGGGTPSVLTLEEWKKFFTYFKERGYLRSALEVTVEVNPDHLDKVYLKGLKDLGVNRLSVGVQSFHNEVLTKMNRSHDSEKALKGLNTAKEVGFDNITLDLIYGVPFQSTEQLNENLDIIESLSIPHISAYQLTIEENTVFGSWKKQGKLLELEDEDCLSQFKLVRNRLIEMGYQHYEVSNFAKPGSKAVHNSSYWNQVKYIGIGPGAHSFQKGDASQSSFRHWNIANNKQYIKSIQSSVLPTEQEELGLKDQFNEAILLGLRQLDTGINIEEMETVFPVYWKSTQDDLKLFLSQKDLKLDDNRIKLSKKGVFVIDYITSELFVL